MLRFLLPNPPDVELIDLDDNLRLGRIRRVRDRLSLLESVRPSPEVTFRLGLVAYLSNAYDDALAQLTQLEQIEKQLNPYRQLLSALIAIDLHQAQKAHSTLDGLSDLWEEHPIKRQYIALARSILMVYLGQFDDAEDTLAHIEFPTQEEPHIQWGRHQWNRIAGVLAHQQTRFLTAKERLVKARAGFAKLGDRYEMARCDYALANTFRRLDNYPQARFHVEQAIDYFLEEEALIPLARCRSALASIQLYFNEQDQALQNYQFALEHFSQASLISDQAWMLHNIGLVYRQMGEFQMAFQAYSQAQTLVSEASYPDIFAHLERSLSELDWHMRRRTKAIQRLQYANTIFIKIGSQAHVANILRLLGNYTFILGDLAQAQDYLERSSKTFLELHRPAQAALTAILLARVIWRRGDQLQAIQMLQTSAEILTQLFMPHRAAEALTWLATFYYEIKQFDEAKVSIERAHKLAPQNHYAFSWRVHFLKARLAIHANDLSTARYHLNETNQLLGRLRAGAMSPFTASDIGNEARHILAISLDLAFRQHDLFSALQSLEQYKAIQFLNRLLMNKKSSMASPDPSNAIERYFERLKQLHRAIQIAHADQNWERLDRLEQDFSHLAQEIDGLQSSYLQLHVNPEWDIQAFRKDLDYQHGRGKWGAYIVGLNGDIEHATELFLFWLDSERLLGERKQLTHVDKHLLSIASRYASSYRRKLLDWNEGINAPKLWQQLEQLLIPAQFEEAINDAKIIYFSPSGKLAMFPFFALRIHGIPVGLQKAISHTASLPMLHILFRHHEPLCFLRSLSEVRGLICAVSHYQHPHLPDLPQTVREALTLSHQLSPESIVLLNEAATTSALRQAFRNEQISPFELIHFSTHARLHPDYAALSHLVLFDGNFYIPDIISLTMHADLVVLATCNSLVAHTWPGDELMGLAHAFMIAGAKRVLAATRPIQDEFGSLFSELFYQNLSQSDSVSEALLATRSDLHSKRKSPFHWGAFSLFGLA